MKNSAEVAGLGGDVRFVRYNLDYQYNKTFFDYFVIFNLFRNIKFEFSIQLNIGKSRRHNSLSQKDLYCLGEKMRKFH